MKERVLRGAIAQLGERLHGMQEVGGSIPPGSTKKINHFRATTSLPTQEVPARPFRDDFQSVSRDI
jgi:hypothetical protein